MPYGIKDCLVGLGGRLSCRCLIWGSIIMRGLRLGRFEWWLRWLDGDWGWSCYRGSCYNLCCYLERCWWCWWRVLSSMLSWVCFVLQSTNFIVSITSITAACYQLQITSANAPLLTSTHPHFLYLSPLSPLSLHS